MVEQIRIIMKAQFLKIAKVKDEKSFYKKYPTEAAFFKAHPEAKKSIKKAQIGAYIGGDINPMAEFIDFNNAYNYADKQATGSTASERNKESYNQQMLEALKSKGGGGGGEGGGASGMDMGSVMKMLDTGAAEGGEGESGGGLMDMFSGSGGESGGGLMDMFSGSGGESGGGFMEMLGGLFGGGGGMKYGGNIPKAYSGTNVNNWWSNITTTPQTTEDPNKFDINKFGIGPQTMGQMKSPPATQTNPVPQGDPNGPGGIMGKNTSGPPYATGNVTPSNLPLEYNSGEGTDQNLSSKLGDFGKLLGPVGGLIEGIDALKAEKEQAARARQMTMLTNLQLKASTTRPEEKERRYVRPEDIVNTGESFFPIYGVGTNPLARNGRFIKKAQDGSRIGGNPTEIQNTYAPGYLYDDLGYVPLINEDQDKNFRYGGDIPRAQTGWQNYMNTMSGGGSGFSGGGEGGGGGGEEGAQLGLDTATGIANQYQGGSGGNAGGKIGKTIGGEMGAYWGVIGRKSGEFVGTVIGNELDPYVKGIKRDNQKTKRNVEGIAYNAMAPAIQAPYEAHVRDGGSIPNYEYGGYMNPEYNPQVIARFGELDAQDFAEFAHKDQYRAGGHLKSYTDPSERGMEQYAMGGELKTHWGGYAETMSHNPYLPGTGETVMFRGKSHEEKSPNGETGIGITYGDNPVEVERGEPMVQLEEGGEIDPETGKPKTSGVVFGNLKIPDQYLDLLGDPKAKGKKMKNYVGRDLFKQEKKGTRLVEQGTAMANKKDATPLELNVARVNIFAGNSMLMTAADRKINLAGIQNAINDTAEEYGIVADDLARGEFKIDKEATNEYARYGKQMFANGGIIEPLEKLKEMLKDKGFDYKQSSGVRPGAKTKQGRKSRHGSGEAMDLVFPKLGKGSYNAMLNDPEIARFMLDNNLTAIDEYDEDNLKQTGGTGGHLHIGLDKGTSLSDKFRKEARLLYDLKTTTPATTTPASSTNATAPVTTTKPIPLKEYTSEEELKADGFKQNANGEWYKSVEGTKKATEKSSASAMDNIPKQQSVDETTGLYGGVTAEEFEEFKKKNQWYPKFKDNTFDQNNPEHVDDLAKAFNAKAEAMGSKARILSDEIDPKTNKRIPGGKTTKIGKQVVSGVLEDVKQEEPGNETLEYATLKQPGTRPVDYKRNKWIDFGNQILDIIRPSDQEPFDYSQAIAEIGALSDQVQPVQAQMYKPQLRIPYDISYQDVLDENQADYNSLVRKTGYNPSAQSNFNANKYLANQKVLGDQFRANQAMKDQVYSGNTDTLNQAKLTNLGIFDKQYERQTEAISNTKAGKLAALTSLQDKMAKHALENKTLGVWESMYKYRYDSKGRAINMNGIFQPNIGTVGSTAGTQKQVPIYGPDGKTVTGYQLQQMTPEEIALQGSNNSGAIPSLATLPININLQSKNKKNSRNGSIVKAIKNL